MTVILRAICLARSSLLRTTCISSTAATGENNILDLKLDSLDHSLCVFQFAHLL